MPYPHPAAGQQSPPPPPPSTSTTIETQQQDTSPSTPQGRTHAVSPHIRPSPGASSPSAQLLRQSKQRHIHRVPPPAILPPVLDSTNSALHLTLSSEAGSTLSTQVDELLSRHLARSPPGGGGGGKNAHVRTGNPAITNIDRLHPHTSAANTPVGHRLPTPPPPLPLKVARPDQAAATPAGPRTMASPQLAPARRPLPTPPSQDSAPYQYPASYGPSISKIRSFPAELPFQYQGLPPGAAHLPSLLMPGRQGLGYGHPHPNLAASAYAQPWANTAEGRNAAPLSKPPQQQSTISRTFAKGGASVMLHKGFFDLLSISSHASPGGDSLPASGYGQGWLGDRPTVPPAPRAVTTPIPRPQAQSLAAPQGKAYRRISVDMIGKPTGFA